MLPETPCAKGQVAWLGETSCHEIADCGTDKFGNPPTDEPLVFVDAAADATTADGSRDKPFTTIGAAIAKVPRSTRSRIAIAEGTYDQQVVINHPIDLWGRCPQKVAIAPTSGPNPYAIVVAGTQSKIERIAVSGVSGGVVAVDSEVRISEAWIHDTGDAGLGGQGDEKDGSLLAEHVLVERARDFGVYALAGTVTLDRSIVRDTRAAGGLRGYGAAAEDKASGKRGRVVVRASVIERNRETGVFAIGSDAIVEGSVVRNTVEADGTAFGAWVTASTLASSRATLSVTDSVFDGLSGAAVYVVESDAEIANTSILRTRSSVAKKSGGQCVFSQRSELSFQDSTCRDARQIGVQLAGGRAVLERALVLDVAPDDLDHGGIGIAAIPNVERPVLTVVDSSLAGLSETGVFVGGGDATVLRGAIRDVGVIGRLFGDGAQVASYPYAGVWFDGAASFDGTVIERASRVGLGAFASTSLSLHEVRISCAAIPLVASSRRGQEAEPLGPAPTLHDQGGSWCGCVGSLTTCQASVESLAPVSL